MPTPKPISAVKAVSRTRTTKPRNRLKRPQRQTRQALKLPHERNESSASVNKDPLAISGSRDLIEQAAKDLKEGRRDTERRGIPNDVPTPSTPERDA